jgi:hypothetical protein
MSGTAGSYFKEPDKKPFSGEAYQQDESDTEIRQKISEYHLAQFLTGVNGKLDEPDIPSEYDKAKSIIKQGETPIIGIQYGGGGRHAVLATKLTILEGKNEAVFEFHDSNLPGTAYDFLYNLETDEKKTSFKAFGPITKFVALDVDDVPLFPAVSWYRSVTAGLVDNIGKVFTSAFTSSGESGQTAALATKTNTSSEAVYVVVENDQGQRAGYLADGTKVNEIDGAVVKQAVTDSTTGEKATFVAVPPNGSYTSSIATSAAGDVRFEHAVPIDSSTAEVNYAESVAFTDESAGTYDEETKEIELDEDGDGTTDKTISTDNSTLPVELTSFDARADGRSAAVLTWQTASEENNVGFEVQRRPSGSQDWRTLGFVDSKASGGTTTEGRTYKYVAENLSVGTHRFRLKQKDLDGSTTFTDPVTVRLQMQEALKLTPSSPNPASKTATLSFAVKEGAKATVAVYNTLGQRVKTLYDGVPPAGENQRIRLDARDLSSGTYFIRLKAGDKTRTQRLTVVR